MRLSDLQTKYIVNVQDGKNIGNIIDVKIDEETGNIVSLVIEPNKNFFSFNKGKVDTEIKWKNIEKIGEDFVEQYFDGNVPYFEAVGLDKSTQENNNKPIDILNSAVKATEETIRTSTINEQAQTIKTVQRDKQSTRQQEEYKENPETKTKSNDNPESFRDTLKFNVSSEMRQEILNRHQETELDFAEGKMDKPEKHKIEDTEYGVR